MTAQPILIYIRIFVKLYAMDPKLEMKLVGAFKQTLLNTDRRTQISLESAIRRLLSTFAIYILKFRVVPDIRLTGYPAFDIRYPVGYLVSYAGYPAGRITGYLVKLLNK